jgi:hypothetical protein
MQRKIGISAGELSAYMAGTAGDCRWRAYEVPEQVGSNSGAVSAPCYTDSVEFREARAA